MIVPTYGADIVFNKNGFKQFAVPGENNLTVELTIVLRDQ